MGSRIYPAPRHRLPRDAHPRAGGAHRGRGIGPRHVYPQLATATPRHARPARRSTAPVVATARLHRALGLVGGVLAVAMLTLGAASAVQTPPAGPAASAPSAPDLVPAVGAGPVPSAASLLSVFVAGVGKGADDGLALSGQSPASAGAACATTPSLGAAVIRPTRAVFLGDSYTTGYNGLGEGAANWAAIVSRHEGWHEVDLAVPGTGYANPGWTGQPLGSMIPTAVRARPGILFVATGHNDDRYPVATTEAAADAALRRLRAALPGVPIVLVGPIWQSGSPPTSIRLLDAHLAGTASRIGAFFIDPIRGGWFGGPWSRLIGADGVHPTDAGQRHIASEILAALQRDPVLRPSTTSATC